MESFEQFVAIAMEREHLVVSEAVKFPIARVTRKERYEEVQTHGYEVDLVGARRDRLVLATVKSFFGSRGVVAEHVMGTGGSLQAQNLYLLLNNPDVRKQVLDAAAERYGYDLEQIRLRLYVGRFAAPSLGHHEARIRAWANTVQAGGGPIEIVGLADVANSVVDAARSRTYRDNPVLTTMKVLDAAGLLAVSNNNLN